MYLGDLENFLAKYKPSFSLLVTRGALLNCAFELLLVCCSYLLLVEALK